MPKRFNLPEARDLLPFVGRLMREAVDLKSQYQQAEQVIQAFGTQIMLMGGMDVDRSRILEARSAREDSSKKLKECLEAIQATGCLVKDLDTGLVDFPTLFHGEEVYLCWKLGERDISHWHGVDEGFAGRKPIDQDFLEHHQGDRTN
jgi:hypothetical protein